MSQLETKSPMKQLETIGLTKRFGGLTVIDNLDFCIQQGEIKGLIGPNGAGKSTFFNLVTGVLLPTSGKILYDDWVDITKTKPHRVAKLGIGRTFQMNPLFGEFTVLENIRAAFHLRPKSSLFDIYFNTMKYRTNEKAITEKSEELIEFLGLTAMRGTLAKNLPHGYQKILGVARALATRPKLLMLDEPLGGLNPEEIEFTIRAIAKMRDQGITVLVVEHNMQVLEILDSVTVISFGQKIFEGTPDEMRQDSTVIATYFGGAI
jgi:ABC-type branched-subunit amino acid transport system ATPase component